MKNICAECGAPYTPDHRESAYCETCRPTDRTPTRRAREANRGSAHDRGYDYRWTQLSRRARRLQPFCTDCGATTDLTADHSTDAWKRKASGLPIRLEDIDVVCRQCNSDRGAARGPDATDKFRTGDTVKFLEISVSTPGEGGHQVPRKTPAAKAQSGTDQEKIANHGQKKGSE